MPKSHVTLIKSTKAGRAGYSDDTLNSMSTGKKFAIYSIALIYLAFKFS